MRVCCLFVSMHACFPCWHRASERCCPCTPDTHRQAHSHARDCLPAARDFVRQCCVLLGQAQDSPLLVTVAAGAAALPTLLKLATVISEQARCTKVHALFPAG